MMDARIILSVSLVVLMALLSGCTQNGDSGSTTGVGDSGSTTEGTVDDTGAVDGGGETGPAVEMNGEYTVDDVEIPFIDTNETVEIGEML